MKPEATVATVVSRAASGRVTEPVLGVPLIVGVTGHRDLRDQDRHRLEELVKGFFDDLKTRYLWTPLVLLSPLAEGADRLVVRVALACGVRVIAPLPMRRELYEKDFQPPNSLEPSGTLEQFATLLEQVDSWFELPTLSEYTEQDIQDYGRPRDRQYEQVGAYIALHSQILLALWDGEESNKVGGTAQIVRFKRRGVPDAYASERSQLYRAEVGPVHHCVTPRRSYPDPRQALTCQWLYPPVETGDAEADSAKAQKVERARDTYDRILLRINLFNRDAATGASHGQIATSKRYVFPHEDDRVLPLDFHPLVTCYATADALAIRFRDLTNRTLLGLFILAFLAALAFGIYAHLEQHPLAALFLYQGVLLAAILCYLWAAPLAAPFRRLERLWALRGDYQNKYQDYRALAEGLRVQIFWCLAGLNASVADHYILKQKSELDWIRQALRGVSLISDAQRLAFKAQRATVPMRWLDLVLQNWVKDQWKYYKQAAERNRTALRRQRLVGNIAFWVGVFLALTLAVGLIVSPTAVAELIDGLWWRLRIQDLLILAMAIFPIVAALFHSLVHQRALAEHAKQYGRMGMVFENASSRLTQIVGPEGLSDYPDPAQLKWAQDLILELGKEALTENGDWVLTHRERPLRWD